MTDIETGAAKCPRSNGGRMQTMYTEEMFINALKEIGQQTTPPQVAEKVGCNPVVARNKLKALRKKGSIQGQNITGRWVFWY